MPSLSYVLPCGRNYYFSRKDNPGYCFLGIMPAIMKKYNIIIAILLFIGLPILFWAVGDFPRRTVLKESISIITLLAFSMMLGQLFLARSNRNMLQDHKMSHILKIHKIIGYIFVGVLLLHPFLIVLPRYFEAGVEPAEAFLTIITSFGSTGIILGIIAWSLMIILGLTSLLRNNLGLKYNTWKVFHGILSGVFISAALWHILNLGRHIDLAMTIFYCSLAGISLISLIKLYFFKNQKAA